MQISWDLGSPVTYQAGQTLAPVLAVTAPRTGKYYLMGALYTSDLAYISDTLFSIYIPNGAAYGTISTSYCSVWDLAGGEEIIVPCQLAFSRTSVALAVFLFRVAEDVPTFGIDEEIGSVLTQLVPPVAPATPEDMLSAAITAAVVVGMGLVVLRRV